MHDSAIGKFDSEHVRKRYEDVFRHLLITNAHSSTHTKTLALPLIDSMAQILGGKAPPMVVYNDRQEWLARRDIPENALEIVQGNLTKALIAFDQAEYAEKTGRVHTASEAIHSYNAAVSENPTKLAIVGIAAISDAKNILSAIGKASGIEVSFSEQLGRF